MNDKYQLLFGKKALSDAINNHLDISHVIVNEQNFQNPFFKQFKNINLKRENNHFFKQFNDVNHQFVITYINNKINYLDLDQAINKYKNQDKVTFLMLDENEDPRNFGSILRSCAAFNVDAVIFKNNHQAQVNDLVIKTSTGAIYYLDLIKVANLNSAIDKLKKANYWIYASSLTENSQNLNQFKFDNRSVIIMGNENHGIKPLVLKNADFIFKIEMSEKIQSLNISVATGIILNKRFNE